MKATANIVSLWFGIIMVTLLLCGSVALIFTDFLNDRLYGNKRWMFIIMCIGYCIYRSYRIYDLIKQNRNEQE